MTTTSTTVFGVRPTNATKDQIITARPQRSSFGVKFPLYDKTNSAKGIFGKSQGLEAIKGQVLQLLNTGGGERLMLPNFGVNFEPYLFEPLSEELALNLRNEVFNAINQWLPEVEILSIRVSEGETLSGLGLPGIKLQVSITTSDITDQTDISITL